MLDNEKLSLKKAEEFVAQLYFDDKFLEHDQEGLYSHLVMNGFSKQVAESTISWVEKLQQSKTLPDVLGMLKPPNASLRLNSALENLTIPEKLTEKLQKFKTNGLINQDVYERLVEALRNADPRDWEKEDMDDFIFELIENIRGIGGDYLADGLLAGKKTQDLYL